MEAEDVVGGIEALEFETLQSVEADACGGLGVQRVQIGLLFESCVAADEARVSRAPIRCDRREGESVCGQAFAQEGCRGCVERLEVPVV